MFKIIFKLLLVIGITWGVFHFLPSEWKLAMKDKALAVLSNIIPESAKEKVKSITYTPEEARGKILKQLEENIALIKQGFENEGKGIKGASTSKTKTTEANTASSSSLPPEIISKEEILEKIEESQKLLNELEAKNKDQTLAQKFGTAIVTKIVGGNSTETSTSTICVPQ